MSITITTPGTSRFGQFASPAEVVQRVDLSPNTALIRLAVPPSLGSFQAGDKVKFAVPGGHPRSYTPARMGGGSLDIVFELHGKGPTASWAARAQPGDVAWTTGALPSLRVPAGRLWFIGDATTLGLAVSLNEDPRYDLAGVVELDAPDELAVARLMLPLAVVEKGRAAHVPPADAEIAVIAGEAGLVSDAHRAMGAARVPRICTKPYWSLRGKAHRKRVAATTGGAR